METVGHWSLLSSVAKAWGEGEPDCILIDSQGEYHLTCRFDSRVRIRTHTRTRTQHIFVS